MKKSIVRVICFNIILFMILGYINQALKVKYGDGIYSVTKFYELEDNTVDVLILGSSHAFENFNTGTLWNEYGMASYIMGGSVQPMWNTYYYLREALKTQTPELIVLEGYCLTFENEYSDTSRIVKNTCGLKWSLDKLNAIKVSTSRDRWYEFIFEYVQYHTRYSEVYKGDFYMSSPYYEDDWKGFGCNMNVWNAEEYDIADITDIDEREEMFGKTEEYYRKIIELAQENNIPIVVVVSPYAGITEHHEALFNTGSDIASEYGVDFINCNLLLDEIGIDFSIDAADANHLSYIGNQRFTYYIGGLLKDMFAISDRKNDERYESWQRNADYIQQLIYNHELTEIDDIYAITEKISNENYNLIISIDGDCNTLNEDLQFFYSSMGITNDELNGIWYIENLNGIIWYTHEQNYEKYITTPGYEIGISRLIDNDKYINQIIINNTEYKLVENGIHVIVYDEITKRIADFFAIDADNDYSIVR